MWNTTTKRYGGNLVAMVYITQDVAWESCRVNLAMFTSSLILAQRISAYRGKVRHQLRRRRSEFAAHAIPLQ